MKSTTFARALAVIGLLGTSSAWAQTSPTGVTTGVTAPALAPAAAPYPTKPITLVVAYSPGGQGDVFARLIAEKLTPRLGQTVVVDNRPGGTGAVGTRLVAKAKGDGYTLLLGQTGEIAVNPWVVKQLGYDPQKDLRPVVLIGDAPLVLVTAATSPYKALPDFIKAAKANPGTLGYASAGAATPGHLAAAALGLGTKTEMIHIPYKGGGQALSDLVGGQVPVFFSSASAAMSLLKSGKLHGLAVSTAQRMASLPQVPTVAESVLPGFSFSLWGGVFAPADTPDAVVQRLNREVNEILAEPGLRTRFEADGIAVPRNSPAEFTDFVKRDAQKYEALVKATGIQAD